MIKRIYSVLVLLFIFPNFVDGDAGANQGSAWVDLGWRRTVARYTVSFDEQGLSTTVFDFEIQALDEKGAASIAQQSFAYNSYFNELSASDLSTVKADGNVVAVDEHAIRDQPASANTSSPYFDEQRLRIIAYPHVAPGDRIRGHLIYKAKRPMFAGEFARYWSQPADQPPELLELTLEGSASRPLHVAMRNVEHREERIGERIVHHVLFKQDMPRPRQIADDTFVDDKRFEASTFADYSAFAAMLNARNAPMARPDEKLSKLSTEIIGGAGDARTKVERIHNWVARNIRYVGIGFEDGGWTSQPASAVLASRYGDCKAHATILKALLAAQGIEANFVAVNADAQFTLTELATPNFNHAIIYVPQIDQYLDPTESLLAFGSLPSSLGGKPALNVDKGTLVRIPIATGERFVMATDTDYTLASDGTRQARSILSGTGFGAGIGRSIAQSLESLDRPSVAKKFIEQAHLSGAGDYSLPNPRELSDSYAITATFQISKPLGLDEPVRIRMLPLTDPRPSFLLLSTGGVHDRAFLCHSLEYRETSSLTIPDGTNFYEKPAPVMYTANLSGNTPYGVASGRVEVKGAVVLDDRTIRSSVLVRLTFDAAVCPAEFATAIKTSWDKFEAFKFGPIGLRPKSTAKITEVSADFNDGVAAFHASRYKQAMTELKPFAETGSAKAQMYLGSMYEGGRGVERDYREAIRWHTLAAEQGEAFSQSHLGLLYDKGLGVKRDEKVAAEWHAKAASQGESYSQSYLAGMYRDGRGVAQDFQQAANLYAQAAEQGDPWAQVHLGLLYTKGQGVPLDYVKAISLFRKAADQNDNYAQYNLGWAYESGLGLSKDKQEAIKWYQKSAEGGNSEASTRLRGLIAEKTVWGVLFQHMGLSSQ